MVNATGEQVRLCKDCKHYGPNDFMSMADECLNPNVRRLIDPVRGEARQTFCGFQRGPIGDCGYDAVKFEPKEAT